MGRMTDEKGVTGHVNLIDLHGDMVYAEPLSALFSDSTLVPLQLMWMLLSSDVTCGTSAIATRS